MSNIYDGASFAEIGKGLISLTIFEKISIIEI